MTARSYCFTLNSKDGREQLDTFSERLRGGINHVRYCAWQLEQGDAGTLHLQGYIELAKPQRLSWLKSHVSGDAHFERRKGTREQARDYCRKEESRVDGPWEIGEWGRGGAGSRSDLAEVVTAVTRGDGLAAIAEQFPIEFIKFHRGIERLINVSGKPRDPEVPHRATLLFGPPGCGKTHRISRKHPGAYWKPCRSHWFDGYIGQDVIIYDDFNRGWFSLDDFCRIVDRYPVAVEYKGGHVNLSNTHSVFTSNTLPRSWYNFEKYGQERLEAITRRFSKFTAFFGKGKSWSTSSYVEFEEFVKTRGQSAGHPYEFQ